VAVQQLRRGIGWESNALKVAVGGAEENGFVEAVGQQILEDAVVPPKVCPIAVMADL
jgi:hypothetical protein